MAPKSWLAFWEADLRTSFPDLLSSRFRPSGLGGEADPGAKSSNRGTFPIAVTAHGLIIRQVWAPKGHSTKLNVSGSKLSGLATGYAVVSAGR